MLRLADVSGPARQSRTFLRLFLPHFALVLVVSVYLLFGAAVFYFLERQHDQRTRINAKIRLNREIRRLTSFMHQQSRYYVAPATPMFDADEPESAAATASFSFDDAIAPPDDALEFDGSGNGSDTFADIWTEAELDWNDQRRKLEQRIFELLHRWEDAIRGYDIRASHVFTEDFLIDRRWETANITRRHLDATESRWTFSSSVLFAFTVITTIGYGNLTPGTFEGRVFCIVYGVVGIPLTMLAIANIGRFLSEFAGMLTDKIRREHAYRRLRRRTMLDRRRKSRLAGQFFQEVVKREDIELKPLSPTWGRGSLLFCFALYIIVGALCLPLWEDMNFFDGCYFSFVTITTVGFGDIVPTRYDYLFPTLVYVTLGLAITTLAIEIFGGFLRQVHYLGSKIKGAKNAFIWFGNKMLTVQELVTAIGRNYGIPQAEIETLNSNMDDVVKATVETKQEELRARKSRRKVVRGRDASKLAPLFADCEFRYIDEDSAPGTPSYNERFARWKRQQAASKDVGT